MIPHRHHGAPVARAHEIGGEHVHDHEIEQHDVVIFAVAGQRQSEQRERRGVGARGAAREPLGAAEEVLQHELGGERRDREIEALEPRGGQADDHPEQSGGDAGQRNAERDRHAMLARQVRRHEGAEAEERGMPERDLAGVADQDVQPQGGDAVVGDLDDEGEPIGRDQGHAADLQRQQAQEHDADRARERRAPGREDRAVLLVADAKIAGRANRDGHVTPARCSWSRTGRRA